MGPRVLISGTWYKFRDLGLIDYNGDEVKVHHSLLDVVLHERPQIKAGS